MTGPRLHDFLTALETEYLPYSHTRDSMGTVSQNVSPVLLGLVYKDDSGATTYLVFSFRRDFQYTVIAVGGTFFDLD